MDSKCFPNNFFPLYFSLFGWGLTTCQKTGVNISFMQISTLSLEFDMVESNVYTSFLFNYSKNLHI